MSKELKQQILNEIATGATAQQCAEKYNIPAGTIRSWVSREKKRSAAKKKPATKNAAQRNKESNATPEPKQPHDSRFCGAKGKQSGQPCKRPAGWGTLHPGTGRCKLHGGCSPGAPKQNKHARTHGAYETVIRDRLSDSEKAVFDSISDESNMSQELKILRFKLLRLLEPVEREMAFGTESGPEIVTIHVDEVTKAFAIEKIVDGIRKVVKDTKETKLPENNSIQIVDDINGES